MTADNDAALHSVAV